MGSLFFLWMFTNSYYNSGHSRANLCNTIHIRTRIFVFLNHIITYQKMNRYFIGMLLLSTIALFSGCEESQNEPEVNKSTSIVDSFRNVVMDLHNEEMGKMGQMMQQERQLKELIAEMDSTAHPAAFEALNLGIMTLDSGSFSMKSWMRNWSEPDTAASIEDQMKGLEFQQDFMEKTSVLMRKGIEMADQLIEEHGTNE